MGGSNSVEAPPVVEPIPPKADTNVIDKNPKVHYVIRLKLVHSTLYSLL